MAKRITKTYNQEFKSQAVKSALEIGGHKAADEPGVPSGTIYAWIKAFKEDRISFYCKSLGVTRQGFHNYLKYKEKPWKYQSLADAMLDICNEDECNDTYGRIRMHQALNLKKPKGVHVPNERTVYRVMEEIGISHRPKRKPNGITKADKEAGKSDDLIKRKFT